MPIKKIEIIPANDITRRFDETNYPITHEEAVIMTSGNTLKETIGNINDTTLPIEIKGKSLTDQIKYLLENGGKVKSVNGQEGDVLLKASDILTANEKTVETELLSKMDKDGGTFTGKVVAHNNTLYTTKQLRNITLSTNSPSGGSNGDIWIKYKP